MTAFDPAGEGAQAARADDLPPHIRDACARVAWQEATMPGHPASVGAYLGLRPSPPYDREKVARMFGETAAQAWQDVVDARRRFFAAAQPQPAQEE